MNIKLLPDEILYLLEIARLGGIRKFILTTTVELGRNLDKSQQTVSRHLGKLEKLEHIERKLEGKKTLLKLTDKGINEIRKWKVIFNEIPLL